MVPAAADQGISSAQLNVGRMYADGVGVAKNEVLARQYFEKAASHGDNRASFNLAVMEEQKKNYVGAYQLALMLNSKWKVICVIKANSLVVTLMPILT